MKITTIALCILISFSSYAESYTCKITKRFNVGGTSLSKTLRPTKLKLSRTHNNRFGYHQELIASFNVPSSSSSYGYEYTSKLNYYFSGIQECKNNNCSLKGYVKEDGRGEKFYINLKEEDGVQIDVPIKGSLWIQCK